MPQESAPQESTPQESTAQENTAQESTAQEGKAQESTSQQVGSQEMFGRGLEKRRAVMGAEFVERAFAGGEDAFGADFQRFMTEYAWGAVWGRGGLTDRERHMVTIGMLAALGREKELAGHLRATANTGVSERDLSDVLHQVAIYAGVPAALNAVNAAKEVLTRGVLNRAPSDDEPAG